MTQPSDIADDDSWRRRHPISPVINTIDNAYRAVRQGWPVLIVLAARGIQALVVGVAVFAVLLAAWTTVSHLRFQYRLTATELEVRSGVLTHNVRSLPVDRVQQVGLNQKLRHQVFDVVGVDVQSAGGAGSPEIKLSVLTVPEAERIRSALNAARQNTARGQAVTLPGGELPPPVVEPEPVLLYRQPLGALFKWSLANSPVLMGLVLVPAFGAVGGFVEGQVGDRFPTGALGVSISIGALALLALVVATIVNMVRYHDMRLTQQGDELRLRYGLLTQQQVDVPRERIQVVTETVTIPGRVADVVGVTAHNASGATGANTTNLPAVPISDRERVSELLAPGLAMRTNLTQHPPAARTRAIARNVRLMLLVGAILAIALRSVWVIPVVLVLLALAVVYGRRAYVVLGHGETANVVVGRAGVWGEVTSYVRRDRVQSASMKANFFQRRRGLATLRVDVAQPLGSVSIKDMADTDASRLLAELTGQPSTGPSLPIASAGDGPTLSETLREMRDDDRH